MNKTPTGVLSSNIVSHLIDLQRIGINKAQMHTSS